MSSNGSTAVLAVDGGGTHCRVAWASGGKVVSVETGPANAMTDTEAAVCAVVDGIKLLSAKVSIGLSELCELPAFVGLAGVTDNEVRSALQKRFPFKRAQVEDDRPAAVRGALGTSNGILAHCGTGSFYGVHRDSHVQLAGGWGPIVGDEASAHWIGLEALRMSLELEDRRRQSTPLLEALQCEFGGGSGIVRFVGKAKPSEIGALAKKVTERLADEDEASIEIMRRGASKLSRSVQKLGFRAGDILCLTGGVGSCYVPFMDENFQVALEEPMGSPLDGAIALALDYAEGTIQ